MTEAEKAPSVQTPSSREASSVQDPIRLLKFVGVWNFSGAWILDAWSFSPRSLELFIHVSFGVAKTIDG
jgi:hypothetical protein